MITMTTREIENEYWYEAVNECRPRNGPGPGVKWEAERARGREKLTALRRANTIH